MRLNGRFLPGFRCRDRICNTWEAYLTWKTREGGVPSEARALLSVSTVHEGNEAVTLSLKQTSHVRVRVPAQQANLTRESKGPDLDLDRFGTAG